MRNEEFPEITGSVLVITILDLDKLAILLCLLNPLGLNLLQELLLVLVQCLHVETDGSLSLGLGAIVRHRDGIGMSVLGGPSYLFQ